jgi:molybdopterin-binding protein
MPSFHVGEAAGLLGVSPDTLRRWVDSGRLPASRTVGGRRVIDGADLAHLAQSLASSPVAHSGSPHASARNRLVGLVTKVVKDKVMAQVDMVCGPYRVVSLISREAADELELVPGVVAVASVKATNVTLELLGS